MPKQLRDFQSALVISNLGLAGHAVTFHLANDHGLSDEQINLLVEAQAKLNQELNMSNRIDRSLGPKSFDNHPKLAAPQPKGWSLKLTTVLKIMVAVLALAFVVGQLHSTSKCQQEVRCAD